MLSRSSKRLVLRALGPLDAFVRSVNGKQSQPPLHLRWEVGPLRGFESSATEYRILLQQYAELTAGSSLLDIGCGCGQLALELSDVLGPHGRYEGWDINPGAIGWCRRSLQKTHPNYSFQLLEVRNGLYRPSTGSNAAHYVLPQAPPSTIVVLKSVFTHMLPDAVMNYLHQIPRLMTDDGRCVASFFLLNDNQRRLGMEGCNRVTFVPFGDGVAVADPHVPEAIVAFEQKNINDMIRDAGLRLLGPPLVGRWTGDPRGITHQDILILERAHGTG
ncbi:MAG: class I SAM-dependent methyltransferase [Bacteroidota bacterium]